MQPSRSASLRLHERLVRSEEPNRQSEGQRRHCLSELERHVPGRRRLVRHRRKNCYSDREATDPFHRTQGAIPGTAFNGGQPDSSGRLKKNGCQQAFRPFDREVVRRGGEGAADLGLAPRERSGLAVEDPPRFAREGSGEGRQGQEVMNFGSLANGRRSTSKSTASSEHEGTSVSPIGKDGHFGGPSETICEGPPARRFGVATSRVRHGADSTDTYT